MNKRIALAALAISVAAAIPAAQAAPAGVSIPSSFNVTVNLTSSCSLSTAPGALSLNYTSFGAAQSVNGNYGVTCTNTLPFTMALDAPASGGVLAGLNYTLTLGTAASAGTGAEQTFAMTYAIAGGQGGTCNGAACSASELRTLTVAY